MDDNDYTEYLKSLDQKYSKEYEEWQKTQPSYFVDDYSKRLQLMFPFIDGRFCYACASTLFSACLPYIRIASRYGPLPFNEMNLIINYSGTGKTLPFDVIRKQTEKLNINLPDKYTTEGIEFYFAQRENPDDELSPYLHRPYGCMTIDEIGQLFTESYSKNHLAGAIEELSQFYDRRLRQTALVKGYRQPQRPNISFIGATIPSSLVLVKDEFFSQGLMGRFYAQFISITPNDDVDISDYDSYLEQDKEIDIYGEKLEKLLNLNISLKPESNDDKQMTLIPIHQEASKMWNIHKKKVLDTWSLHIQNNPIGYEYHYLRRIPELTLREAGRVAISRQVDRILDDESFESVIITVNDLKRGIERSRLNSNNIRELIKFRAMMKEKAITKNQTMRLKYSSAGIQEILKKAPNQMLSTGMLISMSGMDGKTARGYIYQAEEQGRIKQVDKTSITDISERKRLSCDHPRTIVWTIS